MIDQGREEESAAFHELLTSYVAGTLSSSLNVLIASHLELTPRNRPIVEALEGMCGEDLRDFSPIPLENREAMLASILARPREEAPFPQNVAAPNGDELPQALSIFVGLPFKDLNWRRVVPGLKEVKLATHEQGEASLLLVGAGRRMLEHTHDGYEFTLVIKGSFSDDRGRYERGDICIADSRLSHRPQADDAGDCLCFAVTNAPLRLTGPIGRLVQPFLKH